MNFKMLVSLYVIAFLVNSELVLLIYLIRVVIFMQLCSSIYIKLEPILAQCKSNISQAKSVISQHQPGRLILGLYWPDIGASITPILMVFFRGQLKHMHAAIMNCKRGLLRLLPV